ncbi:class I SAM-dependent methyltransferase [Roseateles cavernae]|uniref:class I SAM-dependent methyltransferase n=1 Tax=Roseateles cavernae TaxID=3153578 RepID=UPI0032E40252
MSALPRIACPLCGGLDLLTLPAVRERAYRQCPRCRLSFMQPADRPSPSAEKQAYDRHRNEPGDSHYRAFLDRLALPLAERLRPGDEGLDYGCGPGPALAAMLSERGFPTAAYDPIYASNTELLQRRYDFITCTEVAEHFHDPAAEFARLDALLRPGGWLGLMTQWRQPERDFAAWRYVHDPTHVCFYERATLDWIARRWGWALQCPAANIALFRKLPSPKDASRGAAA